MIRQRNTKIITACKECGRRFAIDTTTQSKIRCDCGEIINVRILEVEEDNEDDSDSELE